jgi:LCP family protein required for cell wall assembly
VARRSPAAAADGLAILPAMAPPHESTPRRRSGFVAAFLSLLFPGLGHAYLGAYRRGLGFAAPPLLIGALVAGIVVRMNQVDLLGVAVQGWFLTAVFVANLVALAYRAAAIIDSWGIARAMNGTPAGAPRSLAIATGGLSLAGLAAVLLVMSVAHLAVAHYDLLLAGTADCVFNADAACVTGANGTAAPGDTTAPTANPSVGPPAPGASVTPWNGTDRLNILLIGADEQNGAHNTDTMITVSIDPIKNQVVLFTLPRDTVDVPVPPTNLAARRLFGPTYAGKINSWFSVVKGRADLYPGTVNTRGYTGLKDIIGNLYGLDIKYYVEVNFDGFEKVVDALGGVTINVQAPVLDDHYPVPAGANQAGGYQQRLYIPAGLQHMTGFQALEYARSRHASSDFDRGARQQRVLVSLRRQTDISAILPSLNALTDAVKESVRTDIPRELVPQLLGLAERIDTHSIRSVIFDPPYYQKETLSSPRGYIIQPYVPRIRAAVQEAFTIDPNFEAAREALTQEAAAVWVLNGSRSSGEASQIAGYLDYLGIAATAPNQRPDISGQPTTTIRLYNGAADRLPLTVGALRQLFGVAPVAVTDPTVHVDIIVITANSTPTLTPPPLP